MPGTTPVAEGITNPPIDELLTKTDSKYKLVLYSAKRARQINAYYSQLGEGLLEYVGPLVETHVHEKPLSIAMREINSASRRVSICSRSFEKIISSTQESATRVFFASRGSRSR